MSDPYYADASVELWLGDCRELTAWLEADVLVCDPPYGMAFESGWSTSPDPIAISGDRDTSARDAALILWGGGAASARLRDVGASRSRPGSGSASSGGSAHWGPAWVT